MIGVCPVLGEAKGAALFRPTHAVSLPPRRASLKLIFNEEDGRCARPAVNVNNGPGHKNLQFGKFITIKATDGWRSAEFSVCLLPRRRKPWRFRLPRRHLTAHTPWSATSVNETNPNGIP